MGPTEVELYRMVSEGLRAQPAWRPFRRRYVPLPARGIIIRGEEWMSEKQGAEGAWLYRRGQAKKMVAALGQVIRAHEVSLAQSFIDMIR